MSKNNLKEEIGFVRPDALIEELSTVKIIGGAADTTKVSTKIDVIKVVNLKTNQEDIACSSYITQYYG